MENTLCPSCQVTCLKAIGYIGVRITFDWWSILNMFITVLSPVIIFQSEKHWGHTLQLCTLPIYYDRHYCLFYLHRYTTQVKLFLLIRYLGGKKPHEDSEGLGHLHWVLKFWVMFPRNGHVQGTKNRDVFPNLGQFQGLRSRNSLW